MEILIFFSFITIVIGVNELVLVPREWANKPRYKKRRIHARYRSGKGRQPRCKGGHRQEPLGSAKGKMGRVS